MVKASTRVWYGVAAIAVVAVLLVGISGVVKAGSKEDGKKGYLGVYMQDLDRDIREGLDLDIKKGVLISGVEEDGPADEAGLEDGDVIVEFNGEPVTSTDDLRDMVRGTPVGEKVKIKVIREGKEKTIDLVVGEWPDDFSWMTVGDLKHDWSFPHANEFIYALGAKPRLGVEVTELNDDLAPYFKTKPGEGVLVLEVDEESVAEAAGIKSGDVIRKVGDEEVSTVKGLRESLEDYEEGDEVPIVLLRKGKSKTVTATMDDPWQNVKWKPHVESFKMPNMRRYHLNSPKIEFEMDDGQIKEQLEDLKIQLKEMRKELDELKKG
jgi:S1-C subfamily serine protease